MERVGPSFSWVMDGRQVGVVGFNLDSRIASRGLILSDLSPKLFREVFTLFRRSSLEEHQLTPLISELKMKVRNGKSF